MTFILKQRALNRVISDAKIIIQNIGIPKPRTTLLHLNLARLDVYSYASAFNAVRGQDTAAASLSVCIEKVQSPSQSIQGQAPLFNSLHPFFHAQHWSILYKFDSSFLASSCTSDCERSQWMNDMWCLKYAEVGTCKLLTLFDSCPRALILHFCTLQCPVRLIAH